MYGNRPIRAGLFTGALVVLVSTSALVAGDMSPWAPPGPTMKPVDRLETRILLHPEMFPLTIDTPGSYYLVGNVTAAGGITVATDAVTIDLNGMTLAGSGGASGIDSIGAPVNITIRNGVIRGWGASGIDLDDAAHVAVVDVVAADNGEHGILIGDRSLVVGCRAANNGWTGITTGSDSVVRNSSASLNGVLTDSDGIAAGAGSVVELCTVHGNGGSGISVTGAALVADCTSSENMLGIEGGMGTRVRGSTVTLNTAGISLGHAGVVTDSIVRVNSSTGILVGEGAIVRSSTVAGNGTGIYVFEDSLVEGCAVWGNLGEGILTGQGTTVRHCTVRENESNGIHVAWDATVVGNNCSRNGSAAGTGGDGAGIYVEGTGSRIEGNLVLSNDRGIETAHGWNTIIRNAASGNGTDFAISAYNDVGPIGAAAATASPWANLQF